MAESTCGLRIVYLLDRTWIFLFFHLLCFPSLDLALRSSLDDCTRAPSAYPSVEARRGPFLISALSTRWADDSTAFFFRSLPTLSDLALMENGKRGTRKSRLGLGLLARLAPQQAARMNSVAIGMTRLFLGLGWCRLGWVWLDYSGKARALVFMLVIPT